MQFKILNSPEDIEYLIDINNKEKNHHYDCFFDERDKIKFIDSIKKHTIQKQAGYSPSKDCNYVSLLVVSTFYVDHDFQGFSFYNTFLIEKDNKIKDYLFNSDKQSKDDDCGESYSSLSHAYHVLSDGKLIEFTIYKSQYKEYEKKLDDMYQIIIHQRLHSHLSNDLTNKSYQKSFKI